LSNYAPAKAASELLRIGAIVPYSIGSHPCVGGGDSLALVVQDLRDGAELCLKFLRSPRS